MSRRQDKLNRANYNYENFMPRNGKKLRRGNYMEYSQFRRVRMYYQLLQMLCVTRFTWTGLPSEIDERFLEITLFQSQMALFFRDLSIGRYMATQANFAGSMNPYLNPTVFQPYGTGYHYKQLGPKECVPIWDNVLRVSMFDLLEVYAERLARLDRSLDVNIDNTNIPLIISCDEKQKLTVMNALRQRQDGEPAILTYDSLDVQGMIQSFPNVTPFNADKLLNAKAQVMNEALSFLGIQNSNTEKKERLITDEVDAGSERVDIYRAGYLKSRQQACDQINRLFKLNVGVNWADPDSGGIIDVQQGGSESE
jgi:hypothetical protein